VDRKTIKVIRSTHPLFTNAVREALLAIRYHPAEIGGRKVSQLVQQPFNFRLMH
jgi:protein TonB